MFNLNHGNWCEQDLWSTAARARGEYLRTHFKNMREVAAALTGNLFIQFNDLRAHIHPLFQQA